MYSSDDEDCHVEYFHGEPFQVVHRLIPRDNIDERKFVKMMNFDPYCYENMISYFGLYNMSFRLELFIEVSRKQFSKVKDENNTVICSISDDCYMMKDSAV